MEIFSTGKRVPERDHVISLGWADSAGDINRTSPLRFMSHLGDVVYTREPGEGFGCTLTPPIWKVKA